MDTNQTCAIDSYFDGEAIFYLGKILLAGLLTVVTLGIGFPWAVCMMMRWTKGHSVINGCRLKFTGTGLQLLGMWLLAEVLVVFAIVGAVIFSAFGAKTFVLAALAVIMLLAWIAVYMHGWTVKHTEFESPAAGYTASPESHRVASESVSANNYAVLLAMGILISLIGLIFILVAPSVWVGVGVVAVGCIVLTFAGNQ